MDREWALLGAHPDREWALLGAHLDRVWDLLGAHQNRVWALLGAHLYNDSNPLSPSSPPFLDETGLFSVN